jgi:hypothetical protein
VGLYTHTLLKLPAGCRWLAGTPPILSGEREGSRRRVDSSGCLAARRTTLVFIRPISRPLYLIQPRPFTHIPLLSPTNQRSRSCALPITRSLPLDNLTRSHQPLSASSPENLCVFLRFATPLPRPFSTFAIYYILFRSDAQRSNPKNSFIVSFENFRAI